MSARARFIFNMAGTKLLRILPDVHQPLPYSVNTFGIKIGKNTGEE